MNFYVPTIEDIDRIKFAMKNNTKLCCEMSPANAVLWARYYKTEIAFQNGELLFRSLGEDGVYSYSCDIQDSLDGKALFDEICRLAMEQKQPLRMHCVMQQEFEQIEEWYPGQYQMTVNRDYCDYIYSREKLATLAGKKLHGKRNHIHRFEEQHPDWSYEPINDSNEQECARMAMHWCMANCMDGEDTIEYDKIDESKLVVYAIRHREQLGVTGGAIRADGRIIAITLGERLTDNAFVVHFEKAYADIQGAYPIINREFVRHELENYVYVNREEDLGEEGLRKAKSSYYPEILLEKGIVTKKQ